MLTKCITIVVYFTVVIIALHFMLEGRRGAPDFIKDGIPIDFDEECVKKDTFVGVQEKNILFEITKKGE